MQKPTVTFSRNDTNVKVTINNLLQLNTLLDKDYEANYDLIGDGNGLGYGYCLQIYSAAGTHLKDVYGYSETYSGDCTYNWRFKDGESYYLESDSYDLLLSRPDDWLTGEYSSVGGTAKAKLCVRLYIFRAVNYNGNMASVLTPQKNDFAHRYDFFIYTEDGGREGKGKEFTVLPPFKCVYSAAFYAEVSDTDGAPTDRTAYEFTVPDLVNIPENTASVNFLSDRMLRTSSESTGVLSDNGELSTVVSYPTVSLWVDSTYESLLPFSSCEWNNIIKSEAIGFHDVSFDNMYVSVSGVVSDVRKVNVKLFDLRYNETMLWRDFNGSCGYVAGLPGMYVHNYSVFAMLGFVIGIPVYLQPEISYSALKLKNSVDFVNTGLRLEMRVFISDTNCTQSALPIADGNGSLKDKNEFSKFFAGEEPFSFKTQGDFEVNVRSCVMNQIFIADDFHSDSNMFYFDRSFHGKFDDGEMVKMIFIACRPVGVTHDVSVDKLPFMVFPRETEYYLI